VLPDRVLDLVLDQIPATPQRRAGWLARRFPIVNSNMVRFGVAAAVLALAVVFGINYLSGPNVGTEPSASPSPSVEATAAASPKPLPTVLGTALTSGTYVLTSFPVHLTVDVPTFEAPAEWFAGCSDGGTVEQSVCFRRLPTSGVFAVGFPLVDNVVADPCADDLLDPPVGPTVDDLVTAISNLAGFGATSPLDITVDGFHGKQFTVTRVSPEVPECGRTWASGTRVNGMGSGEANLVRILDVDGTRIVLTGAYDPAAPEADLALVQQLFASVRIEP
jgi:hypothetical protein